MRSWVLIIALLCGAAHAGEHRQRVNKGMALISVFPGDVRTSTPLTVVVAAKDIPDDAVVEKVVVVTGNITAEKRAAAATVIETYNIKGPGMDEFARKRWAGKNRPTAFRADELGTDPVPLKGTWQISMTGNNAGRARSTTSHTVRALEFTYSSEKERE